MFQLRKNSIGKRLVLIIFFLLFGGLNNYFFNLISVTPLNNNGIEFNAQREKLGIPKIENNWKQSTSLLKTYWYANLPNDTDNGHYKKVIENGFFGIKYESDYYQNENQKGTFVWSKYDFENKSFKYFFFNNSENKPIFVNSKRNFVFESDEDKAKIIVKIDKEELEKYISG
jgi:hypothetical protein